MEKVPSINFTKIKNSPFYFPIVYTSYLLGVLLLLSFNSPDEEFLKSLDRNQMQNLEIFMIFGMTVILMVPVLNFHYDFPAEQNKQNKDLTVPMSVQIELFEKDITPKNNLLNTSMTILSLISMTLFYSFGHMILLICVSLGMGVDISNQPSYLIYYTSLLGGIHILKFISSLEQRRKNTEERIKQTMEE